MGTTFLLLAHLRSRRNFQNPVEAGMIGIEHKYAKNGSSAWSSAGGFLVT
jgi:hypothetical protein